MNLTGLVPVDQRGPIFPTVVRMPTLLGVSCVFGSYDVMCIQYMWSRCVWVRVRGVWVSVCVSIGEGT